MIDRGQGRGTRRWPVLVGTLLLTALSGRAAVAQDANIIIPAAEIETRLQEQPFRILGWRGSRREEDRTQRATIAFPDSFVLIVKWANAPPNGTGRFNNEPRYEVAAYQLQKLFLDEPDYVVPTTVLRAFPIEHVRAQLPEVKPTFKAAPGSVLVALQYWLSAVTPDGYWDEERAGADTAYARHIGDFNILTYVIRHSDANAGNYLVSTEAENPRVFSVDNGVAFASEESDRGAPWRELVVKRLPRRTVERLKAVTRAQLDQALGVLAEYEIRDSALAPVPPGANLDEHKGVRRAGQRIQVGMTEYEIRAVEERIRQLVREADGRKLF
ncbi:MAG: hypothetical protein FIB01_13085 [Gemmatimonadetes bacterium]|nr:hypothetical protein [Gemmatimonadota bacterium]